MGGVSNPQARHILQQSASTIINNSAIGVIACSISLKPSTLYQVAGLVSIKRAAGGAQDSNFAFNTDTGSAPTGVLWVNGAGAFNITTGKDYTGDPAFNDAVLSGWVKTGDTGRLLWQFAQKVAEAFDHELGIRSNLVLEELPFA